MDINTTTRESQKVIKVNSISYILYENMKIFGPAEIIISDQKKILSGNPFAIYIRILDDYAKVKKIIELIGEKKDFDIKVYKRKDEDDMNDYFDVVIKDNSKKELDIVKKYNEYIDFRTDKKESYFSYEPKLVDSIYFKNEEHRHESITLLEKHKKIINGEVKDPWYLSAFYILSSDDNLREKCIPYIENDGISFSRMLKEQDFSSGYRQLVYLAFDLFNHRVFHNKDIEFYPSDLLHTLDSQNFDVAMQAIRLFYDCPVVIK